MNDRRSRSPRWGTHALLDHGDHGLGAARQDPRRVGYLEVGEHLEWSPREGEGWKIPLREVVVRTRKRALGYLFDGVEIEHPRLGILRIRALAFAPGTPLPVTQASTGNARQSGRLRRHMIRGGALEAPTEESV